MLLDEIFDDFANFYLLHDTDVLASRP